MSDEAFAELREAMEDALVFESGKRRELKVTRIQAQRAPKAMSPRDMARVREQLNCSQAVFAMMLSISTTLFRRGNKVQDSDGDAAFSYSRSPKNI